MIAAVAATLLLWVVPPAPSPMPVVHYATSCPAQNFPAGWSCYLPGGDVYIPVHFNRAVVLQHELGHAYDHNDLSDGERARITKVLGWKRWHAENFADFYAACRRGLDPREDWVRGFYGPFRNVRRVARRCALIARAGV